MLNCPWVINLTPAPGKGSSPPFCPPGRKRWNEGIWLEGRKEVRLPKRDFGGQFAIVDLRALENQHQGKALVTAAEGVLTGTTVSFMIPKAKDTSFFSPPDLKQLDRVNFAFAWCPSLAVVDTFERKNGLVAVVMLLVPPDTEPGTRVQLNPNNDPVVTCLGWTINVAQQG